MFRTSVAALALLGTVVVGIPTSMARSPGVISAEAGADIDVAAMPAPRLQGRVVAVNDKTGRITVFYSQTRHFPLEARTTNFEVADKILLAGLAPGDKIRFDANRDAKGFMITHLEHSN